MMNIALARREEGIYHSCRVTMAVTSFFLSFFLFLVMMMGSCDHDDDKLVFFFGRWHDYIGDSSLLL